MPGIVEYILLQTYSLMQSASFYVCCVIFSFFNFVHSCSSCCAIVFFSVSKLNCVIISGTGLWKLLGVMEMGSNIGCFFQIHLPTVSPEMVRPYPKATARKVTTRRPRSAKSRILTDTPVKAAIEQQRSMKKQKSTHSTADKAVTSAKRLKFSGSRHKRVKTLQDSSLTESGVDALCLYCGELWSASREQWIKCQGRCAEWAHISCAGVGKKGQTLCV